MRSAGGCTIVLKGEGSVIAFPDGDYYVNRTGNPGMAKGGSGDVLTGLMAAMLCQLPFRDAVRAAVYLHGLAGDIAAAELGEYGMTPTDIIASLPAGAENRYGGLKCHAAKIAAALMTALMLFLLTACGGDAERSAFEDLRASMAGGTAEITALVTAWGRDGTQTEYTLALRLGARRQARSRPWRRSSSRA